MTTIPEGWTDNLVLRVMHWIDRYEVGLTGEDLQDRIKYEIEKAVAFLPLAAAPAAPEGAETLQEMMSRARAEPGFKEWAKTLKTPEGRAAAMAELAADCEWPLRAVGERVEPVDGKSNGFIWWESLPVGTTLYAAAPPAHTPAPPQTPAAGALREALHYFQFATPALSLRRRGEIHAAALKELNTPVAWGLH
jgi:hypothetical protein